MAEEEDSCTPPDLPENGMEAVKPSLPEKSKLVYEKEYNTFDSWCNENGVATITENVLLAYFEQMSERKKSSTLWASYSMLRACLNVYRDTDISKWPRLIAFLKRQSEGYQPRKSKILEAVDIDRFLSQADDLHYLAIKVVLIMGYAGACRRDELIRMSVDDIEYREDTILVSVPKTKTNVSRMFVITDIQWIGLIKQYANLRPNGVNTKRFFVSYRNGRCTTSPIGINRISQVPRIIATFLKLPRPEEYTGHCFKRSSTSQLGNHGAHLITIKQNGGGKSSVAAAYIKDAFKKKEGVDERLSTASPQPSTSTFKLSDPNSFFSVHHGEHGHDFEQEQHTTNVLNNSCVASSVKQECDEEYDLEHGNSSTNVQDTIYVRNAGGNTSNYQQNIFTQNLPRLSIIAKDSYNVTVKVYNNCNFNVKDERD